MVYSLAVVQALGTSDYFIKVDDLHSNPESAASILPLIEAQPYVERTGFWTDQEFDHDFDVFRQENVVSVNLVDCQGAPFGLSPTVKEASWLRASEPSVVRGSGVVFARSLANRGASLVMEWLYRAIGQNATFIGTEDEWLSFCREIGPISFHRTRDLLEVANALASARLFVGNQSCPLAIAEGLKRPIIQEVHHLTPNCIFYRPDFYPVWHPHQVAGVFRELGKYLY